jgi:hypothetical protein
MTARLELLEADSVEWLGNGCLNLKQRSNECPLGGGTSK